MLRHLMLGAMASLAVAAAATAGPRSLERAMETTTEAVSLPDILPGTIDARGCLACQSMRMELPTTARLFIGDAEVTLKELRQFGLGKRYNMVIFYELNDNVVRRIVITGGPPRSATN